MSRRLYSSFQRSNHRQNESLKTARMQTFQFCLAFAGFFSILFLNCRFVVGEDCPNMLARWSDRKVNESPAEIRADVHKVLFARATQPEAKAEPVSYTHLTLPTKRIV